MRIREKLTSSTDGIFNALYSVNKDKYIEVFEDETQSTLDTYLWFKYGDRSCSQLLLGNTVELTAQVLWLKFYSKWKDYKDTLKTSIDTGHSYTDNTQETYKGDNTNNSNSSNKVYSFDSDDGKTDSSSESDRAGTTNYTRTTHREHDDIKDVISNKASYMKFIDYNQFFDLIFKDIIETIANPLYNLDD